MLKTKFVLLVVSAMLVFTLAAGGTFMLLTDQTNSVSSTMVIGPGITIGSLGVDTPEIVSLGVDTLDQVKCAAPNETLCGAPEIMREDAAGADAYLLVKAELSATCGGAVTIDDILENSSYNGMLGYNSEDWLFQEVSDTVGYFYYINTDKALGLFSAPAGSDVATEAPEIFTEVRFPNFPGNVLEGMLNGSDPEVSINFTAYAMQSVNNAQSIETLASAFGFANPYDAR